VTLKEYIENYIKQNNLTIREFARHCGLSHSVIVKILNNSDYHPDISSLEKISDYTGARLIALLKMAYPATFENDESAPIDELLTEAFNNASEEVQSVILKIVGLK
jgi:transcriptional regulator with XRE-family HTH domain